MRTRKDILSLTPEELPALRRTMTEFQRRGGPQSFIALAGYYRTLCGHYSPYQSANRKWWQEPLIQLTGMNSVADWFLTSLSFLQQTSHCNGPEMEREIAGNVETTAGCRR